jgi:hypothetical protein
MKVVFAFGAVLFVLAGISEGHAQAKCLVPPITEEGKCLQRAGAKCDPAKGWVGGNEAACTACRNAEARRKNCVRCTARAAQCGDDPTACNTGGRRDPWVRSNTTCGSWYRGCNE